MRTASLGRRRRPHAPAAGPLDDDDLLREILIRLPPQPSSLPRASAVCKRWRRLVSDPTFFRRFRLHHRRNPPLLGFFQGTGIGSQGMTFVPTLEKVAVIEVPSDMCSEDIRFGIMRAEGGGLGVLLVSDSDCTVQLWKRKTDWGGVASWSLARTIELGKLLSLKSEEKGPLYIPGFAEENNTVFMWTSAGLFMIHLESLKFSKISEGKPGTFYHPFESAYAAEICAGSGHDGAELLCKT